MQVSSIEIAIGLSSSAIGGLITAIYTAKQERKKEQIWAEQKAQDALKIDLKDLQIKLYKLEKDLDEWKGKYYDAIQELIRVKAELEDALIKLTHAEIHYEN